MTYTKTYWKDRIKDSQGNIIQEGTPVSAGNLNNMENGIAEAHRQMEQQDKETVSLPYGLSTLNSPNGSPLDIEIEGRTLISLATSVLEGGKYYVLANSDSRTAIVLDGATYKGIAKFLGVNARPGVIRTANLDSKVSGSVVENPHISKYRSGSTSLLVPSDALFAEMAGSNYPNLSTLNASVVLTSSLGSGQIAQHLFSFNIIEEFERRVGKIPGSTVTDRVNWLKNNLNKLTFNWYGFGSSVGGNKASVKFFRVPDTTWESNSGGGNHTSGSVTKIPQYIANIANYIDTNGFVHFLAHAEASDGTTASVINTDYVELDIEVKSTADFSAPRVPLYEVPQSSYDKILVEWDAASVANRYPSVEGMKSLQNPIVTVEGANLSPTFYEAFLHANASVISPYQLELNATAINQSSYFIIPVQPNTDYLLNMVTDGFVGVYTADGTTSLSGAGYQSPFPKKFNTGVNTSIRVYMSNNNSATGKFTFSNPMLTLGSMPKSFVPRNQSFLYVETILRGVNGINDVLYQEDGKRKVLKKWDEINLDNTLNWSLFSNKTGYKSVGIATTTLLANAMKALDSYKVMSNRGILFKNSGDDTLGVNYAYIYPDSRFQLTLSNADTGFVDTYTPVSDEIKAYFNGWKVKTVDGSNKPTAWVSVLDGKDAATQTLAYVAANKAPNYTTYKLLYQLASPKTIDITEMVEGALIVTGQVQAFLDSGVIVKEKVTPLVGSDGNYFINSPTAGYEASLLKNKAKMILGVYRGSIQITPEAIFSTMNIKIPKESYDAAADYYVTYLLADKQKFTSNPTNVKASYNTSIRSSLDQVVEQLADTRALTSIHDRYLYKLLLAAKANGWSV